MSFGEKLLQARKRCGMTQKELAEAVGAKHNSVSNWEGDRNMPESSIIRRLCEVLGVDANYFYDAAPMLEGLSGVEFALFGEVRGLTEEDQQDVLEFIRFKKALREKRENE